MTDLARLIEKAESCAEMPAWARATSVGEDLQEIWKAIALLANILKARAALAEEK